MIRGGVYDWGRKADKPLLDNRLLLEGKRPVRWLRNDSLKTSPMPPAFVEFVGGDRVPGKVVQYRARANPDSQRSVEAGGPSEGHPAHLVLEPAPGLVMHRANQRLEIRLLLPWLRRIVWQRTGSGATSRAPSGCDPGASFPFVRCSSPSAASSC